MGKQMNTVKYIKRFMGAIVAFVVITSSTSIAWAAPQAPVDLGTASAYSVLGGVSVSNTGNSTLSGNLGASPGLPASITGFPPGLVAGETHAGDAQALQAQADLVAAYDDVAGRTPVTLGGVELGGTTVTPGAYNTGGVLGITGTLTLDAQGDPNAVFIFQSTSTLITAPGSSVSLINGADACNVYWLVPSSATLDTGSTFAGTILALTSISVNDSVTIQGRTLARNGSVTLINDTFTSIPCVTPTSSPTPAPSTSASETSAPVETPVAESDTLANTGIETWVAWLIVGLAVFAGIITYLFGHLKRRRARNTP
jgi:type VI secretion system secreted protein VgrG